MKIIIRAALPLFFFASILFSGCGKKETPPPKSSGPEKPTLAERLKKNKKKKPKPEFKPWVFSVNLEAAEIRRSDGEDLLIEEITPSLFYNFAQEETPGNGRTKRGILVVRRVTYPADLPEAPELRSSRYMQRELLAFNHMQTAMRYRAYVVYKNPTGKKGAEEKPYIRQEVTFPPNVGRYLKFEGKTKNTGSMIDYGFLANLLGRPVGKTMGSFEAYTPEGGVSTSLFWKIDTDLYLRARVNMSEQLFCAVPMLEDEIDLNIPKFDKRLELHAADPDYKLPPDATIRRMAENAEQPDDFMIISSNYASLLIGEFHKRYPGEKIWEHKFVTVTMPMPVRISLVRDMPLDDFRDLELPEGLPDE